MAGLVTGDSIVNPDSKLSNAGVEVIIDRVERVDRKAKVAFLKSGRELPYDKLVLGTGSSPIVPPIEGKDLDGVFILRSLSHAEMIRNFMKERKPRSMTFIGAGFISLEIATLVKQAEPDIQINIIELFETPVPTMLDPDLAAKVSESLSAMGIKLEMGQKVTRISGKEGKVSEVHLESGKSVPSEIVFLNVGARPSAELAKDMGLEMGQFGVKVNSFLETSDPDILAAGDCVDNKHFITGESNPGALRGPAVIMGRLVAKRLAGSEIPFPGLLNASACSLVDIHVASTGFNEQQAKAEGFETISATVDSRSKHGMIPGAKPWTLKLVFERKTHKLLGGQIVSKEIAPVKEIDAISALILGGKTIEDLTVFMTAGNPDCSSEPSLEPIAIAGEQALQKLKS